MERFSIGFGPKLWSFHRADTEFCISLIPLGGYVLPKVESEDDFYKISPLKRIVFALGGPLANILSVIPLMAAYNTVTKGISLSGLFFHPFLQTAGYIEKIITAIPLIFSHPQQLSGVVGIVTEGSKALSFGITGLLALTAFLSINLAILNLLPVPALDGGSIVMTILEKVWPRSTKLRVSLSLMGWLFLISIMVYATTKDISRLLG